jgi:hypothetical protein
VLLETIRAARAPCLLSAAERRPNELTLTLTLTLALALALALILTLTLAL